MKRTIVGLVFAFILLGCSQGADDSIENGKEKPTIPVVIEKPTPPAEEPKEEVKNIHWEEVLGTWSNELDGRFYQINKDGNYDWRVMGIWGEPEVLSECFELKFELDTEIDRYIITRSDSSKLERFYKYNGEKFISEDKGNLPFNLFDEISVSLKIRNFYPYYNKEYLEVSPWPERGRGAPLFKRAQ